MTFNERRCEMKIKTTELKDLALDWAAAKAAEEAFGFYSGDFYVAGEDAPYHPSTKWSQGGPIIEREKCIATMERLNGGHWRVQGPYDITHDRPGAFYYGPTPLIAAMRAFVASKLGDEVEIPEELLQVRARKDNSGFVVNN